MKNKVPPFVPNSKDGWRCVPAVFRMLNRYYFGEDLTWREVDEMLHFVKGKGTWTIPGLTALSKKGLDILSIEPIDYQKLYEEGTDYLTRIFGKDTVIYYLEYSNIKSVIPLIPEFLKNVKHLNRKTSVKEIIQFLKKGSLIGVEINSRILNKKEGFSLHYVLIYDFDGKNFYLHDPGLPPEEARKVPVKDFEKAFAYPGANLAIAVFKKNKSPQP